ncbi:MAG: hypothetical protein Q8O14_09215 [bacterium]|jgi:hypothetical protein|nr:hypothetical protein [bacterium]
MPIFPKAPGREFRYTPFFYKAEEETSLRERLSLRRPTARPSFYLPMVKLGLLLALALAVYQLLHPEEARRLLRPTLTIGEGDVVAPPVGGEAAP